MAFNENRYKTTEPRNRPNPVSGLWRAHTSDTSSTEVAIAKHNRTLVKRRERSLERFAADPWNPAAEGIT